MTEHEAHSSIHAHLTPLPDKVGVEGLEQTWGQRWEDSGTYTFGNTTERSKVYSIDTPPPTISGHLHVGHVFSYTHTDIIARFKRMCGFDVFYPMGWDDNGLPTERRVQNYYGVRVDTSLSYDPNFKPPFEGTEGKTINAKDQVPISRQNFIELCEKLTAQDEVRFEQLWRTLGLSVDWKQTYNTIGERVRKTSQKAFLHNLKRGEAYQQEAPGLWDVTFQTAVAQAELESREYPGHYHRIAFVTEDNETIYIETTRPELLPACTALIAHPEDDRYTSYFGKEVYSPIFHVKVPILAHPSAEIDKGAGIAMCCAFGDMTDVQWWRDLHLPMRSIIQHNGRIVMETPEWITDETGRQAFSAIAGKTTFSARKELVDLLRESGDLDGEPKPTMRMTNFYEKGDKPLEIVTSRQWYIRNGGTDMELREALLERGKELDFHPAFMRTRYENWVNGLNGDWLISRQRFFGIPFPLWYPLNSQGEVDYDHPLLPDESILPIDPTIDVPEGYTEDQRGQAGGFIAENDVMDTWATSSLTPQIACHWADDDEQGKALFNATFPMDLRPQGQDIIRTWLFGSVARAHLAHNSLPWKHAALSGWILDPDHKKMSKSKGNVVVPDQPITKFGADAARYWAACAKLGLDATYDEGQMKIGRRLAIKLLNATKFALSIGREDEEHHVTTSADLEWKLDDVCEPLDRAVLARLAQVIDLATAALESYEHSKALETIETFFWQCCDDYIELVKNRAYGFDLNNDGLNNDGLNNDDLAAEAHMQSARTTLGIVFDALTRLLAPYMPYVTEEVWSWMHAGEASVHKSAWPQAAWLEPVTRDVDASLLTLAGAALAAVRKIKSEAKVSMKTPLLEVTLAGSCQETLDALESLRSDLAQAGRITGELTFTLLSNEDQASVSTSEQISTLEVVKEANAEATDNASSTNTTAHNIVSVVSSHLGEAPAKTALK